MAFTISYIYKAVDSFSPVARKISTKVEKVSKGFDKSKKSVDKASKAIKKFGQNAKKSLAKASKAAEKLGKDISIKAGIPIAGFSAISLNAFNEQEKALVKVRQGLKSTGGTAKLTFDQLTRAASNLQTKTLFGDEEILGKATSTLLTFTKISGKTFLETQRLALDLSARFGTDLQSSALQLGKALNDPVKGLGALSRAGIQFSDKQKTVIEALVETGQISRAQALILRELQTQFGGTAEAMADIGTGRLTQLNNVIGDVNEQIGKAIFETSGLKEIIVSLSGFFIKLGNGVESFVRNNPKLTKFIVILGAALVILGPLLFLLAKVVIAVKLLAFAWGLVSLASLPITGTILAIAAGIAAVVAGSVLIITYWQEIKTTILGVIQAVVDKISAVGGFFADLFSFGDDGPKIPAVAGAGAGVGGVGAASGLASSKSESDITIRLVDKNNNVENIAVKHRGRNRPRVGRNNSR